MIGAVYDSNVCVSAWLFGGIPRRALELAQQGVFQAIVSPFIITEVQRTLRLKFRWSESEIRTAAMELQGAAEQVRPQIKLADCVDPDDNRVAVFHFIGHTSHDPQLESELGRRTVGGTVDSHPSERRHPSKNVCRWANRNVSFRVIRVTVTKTEQT